MNYTPYIKVSEVMTPSVRTIDALATVRDTIKILDEANLSSLVIERRDDADEQGIITIFDITRDVITESDPPTGSTATRS
jgi:predicted transcriptional regulator